MGGKKLPNLLHKIKKFFVGIKNLKTWQLSLLLIPLGFLIATLLRFNHLKMTELRAKVLTADQSENDAEILTSLVELQSFTRSHVVINIVEKNGVSQVTFGTGPFYLEKQYIRKASAKLAEAEAKAATLSDDNPNGNVFAKAMAVCRPLAIQNGWQWNDPNYINCFTGEISKYPTSDKLTTTLTADIPSTSLYRHDFASPLWAFDLAGILVIAFVLLSILILLRVLIWIVLRLALLFIK